MDIKENNTIHVTGYVFQVLLDQIFERFKSTQENDAPSRVAQLYGFGNYNEKKPNLRSELENLLGEFVNGKYLYEKSREMKSGKSTIRLNGQYRWLYFKYVGYKDIESFTKSFITDKSECERQLNLILKTIVEKTYYYVSYHFGENKEVVKSQVTILNGWRNAKYKYIYYQQDGTYKEYFYHGKIIKNADIIHIKTQTQFGTKMVEGGEDILYTGHTQPGSSAFILGTYSAFDIYNKIIAGTLIFEKCATKEEMLTKSMTRHIPSHIAQEIRNKRFTNIGVVPDDVFQISSKSPFSSTYGKIPGTYNCIFFQGESKLGAFNFSIDKDSYKIKPESSEVLVEADHFELVNKGSVIKFSFQITGISLFSNLEIFLKAYYLQGAEKVIKGVYSGLDIENRLISGEVEVSYEAW